jgi:hypothetical protein
MPKDDGKKLRLVDDDGNEVEVLGKDEQKLVFDDLLRFIHRRGHELIDAEQPENSPFTLVNKIVEEAIGAAELESKNEIVH